MWNDREVNYCHFILSLHSAGGGRGPWLVVVITCTTCLFQSMVRTIISGWHILIIWLCCVKPSGCYVYKCRLIFLEIVQMGKARHVCFIRRSGWGWLGWQCVPCVTVRCVSRVLGGRGPYTHLWSKGFNKIQTVFKLLQRRELGAHIKWRLSCATLYLMFQLVRFKSWISKLLQSI